MRRSPLTLALSPEGARVATPFMVPFDCAQGRLLHHERCCSIANSSTYPFALSSSKGSDRIATQSLGGERTISLSTLALWERQG
jgi:hypothetical protein